MHPILSLINIQIPFRNCQNFSLCNWLGHKVRSNIFSRAILDSQISFFGFLREKYNITFKCLVLFLEPFLPFSCSRIVLLLSWYILFGSILYPCDSIKTLVHNIILNSSSTSTNSTSVLLFVLSFCFCDTDTIYRFTIVNVSPLWDLKYEFTMNSESAFNVRHNLWVTTIKFISLSSLFQSTWLGCSTLVRKTTIVSWTYYLDIFHKNKPLATVVWNDYNLFFLRGLLLSTLNRSLVSGILNTWDFLIFIGNSSIMFFTYFRISIFNSPFVV